MAITFDRNEKVILITAPQTSVLIQDLIDAIRDYEDNQENMDMSVIANATGKQDLGNNKYVAITLELLDDWRIQFEDRSGPDYIMCQITGGNLVTVNSFNNSPIKQSLYTYVVLELSSSATLIKEQLITERSRIIPR